MNKRKHVLKETTATKTTKIHKRTVNQWIRFRLPPVIINKRQTERKCKVISSGSQQLWKTRRWTINKVSCTNSGFSRLLFWLELYLSVCQRYIYTTYALYNATTVVTLSVNLNECGCVVGLFFSYLLNVLFQHEACPFTVVCRRL